MALRCGGVNGCIEYNARGEWPGWNENVMCIRNYNIEKLRAMWRVHIQLGPDFVG